MRKLIIILIVGAALWPVDRLVWYLAVVPQAVEEFQSRIEGKYQNPPYYGDYVLLTRRELSPDCIDRFSVGECYREALQNYYEHILYQDFSTGEHRVLELDEECVNDCVILFDRKFLLRADISREFVEKNLQIDQSDYGAARGQCEEFKVAYGYVAEICEWDLRSGDRIFLQSSVLKITVPHLTINPFRRANVWRYGLAGTHIHYRTNSMKSCTSKLFNGKYCVEILGENHND